MIVLRVYLVAAALFCGLWVGAGCTDRDNAQLTPETDDPYYVQGVQWKRQTRNPEALTSFLKVIDKRGEHGAPESHLQVGDIYLNHIKEPVYAYYHFKRYLELQPNSPQSELVRGMVKASLREFAKTLPGRPVDEQGVHVQSDDEVFRLRRENEQLRAELAVLRGGGGAALKQAPRMITAPLDSRAVPVAVPTATIAEPPANSFAIRPAANNAPAIQPAPPSVRPVVTVSPQRIDTGMRSPPASSGRTHTVAPKETLFGLSKRYGVTIEELVAANGLPSATAPIKIGTVLKIPAPKSGR